MRAVERYVYVKRGPREWLTPQGRWNRSRHFAQVFHDEADAARQAANYGGVVYEMVWEGERLLRSGPVPLRSDVPK